MPVQIEVTERAKDFLEDLAKRHPMYPDTVEGVVDQLIEEWHDREHKEWE